MWMHPEKLSVFFATVNVVQTANYIQDLKMSL